MYFLCVIIILKSIIILNLAKFLMYYSRSCTVCSQILDTCMMIAKLIVWLLKLNLYIQILLLNGVESMHRRRLFWDGKLF